MKELPFNRGRLTFSPTTLTMVPCLPDSLELRIKLFCLDEEGLVEAGFF